MSVLLWPQYACKQKELDDEQIIGYQVFKRTDKEDPRCLRLHIVDRKFVSKMNSEIYRATLRCDGHADRDVICKMVCGETNILRLVNETEFYDLELEPFQGKCVPVFHGLFEFKDGDGSIGMIVMDYVGEHLTEPILAQPWELRYARFFSSMIRH